MGLILAKLRGIDQAVRDQQHGLWRPERRQSLADRRVLLLGVGGIGHEIARRLEPFEVTVTRVGSTARTDEHGEVHASADLTALAATHDILVSVLPLNEQHPPPDRRRGPRRPAGRRTGGERGPRLRGGHSCPDQGSPVRPPAVRPRRRRSGTAAAGPPAVVHTRTRSSPRTSAATPRPSSPGS